MRTAPWALATFLLLAACGGGGQAGGARAATPEAPAAQGPVVELQDGDAIGGSGDFDQHEAVTAIRGVLPSIRDCYAHELSRDATLAGRVQVEFTIALDGSVNDVLANASGNVDAAVTSCVTGAIDPLVFAPAPHGGTVTFRYPLVLRPR